MDPEFWKKRWQDGQIGFHLDHVNPHLPHFIERCEDGRRPLRALVPLCGKSQDLGWLRARGHDVTGVELSGIAVRDFFGDRALVPATAREGPFLVHRSPGLTLLEGDFFDLDPQVHGTFELIYDRAALIALPAHVRARYAHHLRTLAAPGARSLVIALRFDQSACGGPPFSVDDAEIRRLFRGATIELLSEEECLAANPHFKDKGLTALYESAYLIGG